MTLGGELEWNWVWEAPSTDCRVVSAPSIGMEVNFDHGGQTLQFVIANPVLQPGTYPLTLLIYEDAGRQWQLDGSTTCTVEIEDYELVDWVQDDHHRFSGTLVCTGPLRELFDDTELTLSEVTFSVYAGRHF
jgi:hypothetical protein